MFIDCTVVYIDTKSVINNHDTSMTTMRKEEKTVIFLIKTPSTPAKAESSNNNITENGKSVIPIIKT